MKSWILVGVCSGLVHDQLRVQTVVGPDGRIEPSPAALAEQLRKNAWDFHVTGHHDAVAPVARRRHDAQERPADISVAPDTEDPTLGAALEHYLQSEQDRVAEGGPPRRVPALMSHPVQIDDDAPRLAEGPPRGDAKVMKAERAASNMTATHRPITIDDLITRRQENDSGLGRKPIEAPPETATTPASTPAPPPTTTTLAPPTTTTTLAPTTTTSTTTTTTTLAPTTTPAPTTTLAPTTTTTTTTTPAPTTPMAGPTTAPPTAPTTYPTAAQRLAVVRITAKEPDCKEATMPGSAACAGGQEVFGSGFFLQIPDFTGSCGDAGRIVIITNAHVVGDSKDLKFEMPDLTGRVAYDVVAISVNVEWDIAVLDISDTIKADIKSALGAKNVDLNGADFPALELALDSDQVLNGASFSDVNEAVVSIGYPLAQDTSVASDGIRSGGEIVFGNYVYEFDAQISPGSSGGCVVRKTDGKVIGISFASVNSAEAESLNFAIPAFRVAIQLASVFCGAGASPTISTCDGGNALLADCEFNVAQINTQYEEGSQELLQSHNCDRGVFVNEVPQQSIYRSAGLPAYEKIFITRLRPDTWNAEVDQFGFVNAPSVFSSTPVPLDDALFFLDPRVGEDINTPVSIEVCVSGNTATYQLDLADNARYELPIENLKQPSLHVFYYGSHQASKIQAERFGPIVVRQAGVALAAECAHHGQLYKHADILQAAEEEFLYNEEPALIVVQAPVSANPQAEGYVHSISACDEVKFLNGEIVKTMEDFAKHYKPQNGQLWTLETHSGLEFEAPYQPTLSTMLQELQSGFILTPIARKKAEDEGLDVDQAILDATNAQANPTFVQQSDNSVEKSAETNANSSLFVEASGLDVAHAAIKKQRPKIPAAVSLLNMVEAAAQMALLGTSEKDELLRTQLHHFTLQQSKRGHSQFWHKYRKKRGVQGAQRRSFAADV